MRWHSTVVLAVALLPSGRLYAMTVAVLLMIGQEAWSGDALGVGEVSLIVFTASGGISPKLQETAPAVFVQAAPSVPPTDQASPVSVGRVSVSVTLFAMPSPLLVIVIVKPIGSTVLTLS